MRLLARPVAVLNLARKIITVPKSVNISYIQKVINNFPSLTAKLNEAIPNDQTWKEIRKKLLDTNLVKEQSVDSTLLETCLHEAKTDNITEIAHSYLTFLRNNNYNVNLAVANRIIRLLGQTDNPTKKNKENILWLYDNIFKKLPFLDKVLTANVIIGLTATERWEEAEQIIDSSTLYTAKQAWILACYKNNRPDKGWSYLQKMDRVYLQDKTIKEYFQHCLRNFDNKYDKEKQVSNLLSLCKYNNLLITKDGANELIDGTSLIGWKPEFVYINRLGTCPNCKNMLSRSQLNKEEYEMLSNFVLDKVLISSDVYQGTNPEEVEKYVSFVDKTIPYDYVIDGLNMLYMHNNAQILPMLVTLLLNDNTKILLLIRKHAAKLINRNPIFKNVHVFYLDNLTRDDAFALYATLKSGRHTKFISNDLMRAQKFLLENDELKDLFKKWQTVNQLRLTSANLKTKKISFQIPVKYPISINEDKNGYHVPYTMNMSSPDLYEMLNTWVCLRKSLNPSLSKMIRVVGSSGYQQMAKLLQFALGTLLLHGSGIFHTFSCALTLSNR